MLRYKLRTLLIVLGLGPVMLAAAYYWISEPEIAGRVVPVVAIFVVAVWLMTRLVVHLNTRM